MPYSGVPSWRQQGCRRLSASPGVAHTTNPGQSFESLYRDVVERVFATHDDDTWFHPGHGDDSTLAAERPQLGEWRGRGW